MKIKTPSTGVGICTPDRQSMENNMSFDRLSDAIFDSGFNRVRQVEHQEPQKPRPKITDEMR